jgi:GNAT superfamily N-acetyltransferase
MSMILHPAIEADLPDVVNLMNVAFRATGPVASWNTEGEFIDGVRTTLILLREELAASPRGVLLILRSKETSVLEGCVWLEPMNGDTWYLGSLTVDPRLQKFGLGSRMLAVAEQWAIDSGARSIQMRVVNIRRPLIEWYERRGYRMTGETHPFPYGDDRFGKPKRDDLSFIVLEKTVAAEMRQRYCWNGPKR